MFTPLSLADSIKNNNNNSSLYELIINQNYLACKIQIIF